MDSTPPAETKAKRVASLAKPLLESAVDLLTTDSAAELIGQIDAVFDVWQEVCPGGHFYREAVRRGLAGNLTDEMRKRIEQSDRYRRAYEAVRRLIEDGRVSSDAEEAGNSGPQSADVWIVPGASPRGGLPLNARSSGTDRPHLSVAWNCL
jgi:hypothetical protein